MGKATQAALVSKRSAQSYFPVSIRIEPGAFRSLGSTILLRETAKLPPIRPPESGSEVLGLEEKLSRKNDM
jgi:hypothetical protein